MTVWENRKKPISEASKFCWKKTGGSCKAILIRQAKVEVYFRFSGDNLNPKKDRIKKHV